jgi:hypothetical protein
VPAGHLLGPSGPLVLAAVRLTVIPTGSRLLHSVHRVSNPDLDMPAQR